ncbi:DUF2784 domain-containing protein [Pedobacter frigoris]|uniref:DUF2784 domain-containing protein n=1 Tax=Pedobacter frigoris TaxID=2571272 RepID=A0A4U1CKE7_9SPHI|nr:DUF2784 domain-containing protein [Pedobacter frigoris]TKC05899.1 DUF2784 domain-containing protein [Pedobacter frigoris]
MNHLLDLLFTFLHLIIIGFNLFAWIWRPTRRLHLIVAGITLGCWFILGIWFGIGYCPITDWQWTIKESLGETNLPNSFVKYYADKISGLDISSDVIDAITVISFLSAISLSVYLNFFNRKQKQ